MFAIVSLLRVPPSSPAAVGGLYIPRGPNLQRLQAAMPDISQSVQKHTKELQALMCVCGGVVVGLGGCHCVVVPATHSTMRATPFDSFCLFVCSSLFPFCANPLYTSLPLLRTSSYKPRVNLTELVVRLVDGFVSD